MNKQIITFIIAVLFLNQGCQPDCQDILFDTIPAVIFRFEIVDKNTGDNLISDSQTLTLDSLTLSVFSDSSEVKQLEYVQLDTLEGGGVYVAANLLFNQAFDLMRHDYLIIDYGADYSADTLSFDYWNAAPECGASEIDFTITLNDNILCDRCYQQLITIEK